MALAPTDPARGQRLPNELIRQVADHLIADGARQTLNGMSQMNREWHQELHAQRASALFSTALEQSIPEHSELSSRDRFFDRPLLAADLDPNGGLHRAPARDASDLNMAFFNTPRNVPMTVPTGVGQLPDSVKGEGLAMVTQASMRMGRRLPPTLRPRLTAISAALDAQLGVTGSNPLLPALLRTGPGRPALRTEDQDVINRYLAIHPRPSANRATPQERALDAAARFLDRFRPAGLPDSLEGFSTRTSEDIDYFISIYMTHAPAAARPSENAMRSALTGLRTLRAIEDPSDALDRSRPEGRHGVASSQGSTSAAAPLRHPRFATLVQASMSPLSRGVRFRVFVGDVEQEFITVHDRQGGEPGFLKDIRPVVRGG